MRCRARAFVLAWLLGLVGAGVGVAQPYGLETRQPIGPFLNNTLPPREQSAAWGLVEAFPNLSFESPVCFTPEPRTNRLYVCQQNGRIYFFENNPATTNRTLFLDLSAVTLGVNDAGMFGLAFHPEFGLPGSTNRGYVYVYYSYTPALPANPGSGTPSYNRLSRFTVPDGSLVAEPNSQLVLINQFDEHWWHNGGGLFFGTDGFLYLSMGDEGLANDSFDNTQKINDGLFAGVLRIDVDMDSTRSHPIRRQPQNGGTLPGGAGWVNSYSSNYFVPDDNPWQDPGGAVLEEFYAIGLRSPHRMTQDPNTGRIWLGDVGQDTMEEVNLIEAGGNYQWAYKEGTITGPKPKPSPLLGVDQAPVYAYDRSQGNCVIGGYVYRGSEHAAYLSGKYIFGDNGSGSIWAMDYNGAATPPLTYLCTTPPGSSYNNLSSFGLDHDGEIYVLVVGAQRKIYKLVRTAEQSPPPPELLSQTGVFTNLTTLTANPALIPYDVNTPLWSDGAVKQRWLAVPNDGAPYTANELINFAPTGSWNFPVGTVFVKHFDLPVNETNGNELKRLETRLLTRGTNGHWYGLTYKWRADNSDADLLPASLNETNFIQTSTGWRTQVWYYPSRQDCLRCHTTSANYVLGPRTCQMNGDLTYPDSGVTDNQLRALNHLGLFSPALNEATLTNYPRLASIDDANATLELRARSYLDANCAHCHRPNGVRAFFDARFDTPLADQGIVGRIPLDDLGVSDAKIIAPLSPAQSVMHLRMNSVGAIKMPPLAKNLVDEEAVALLAAWINSLPPTIPLPEPWAHQEIGPMGVPGNAAFSYSSNRFTLNAAGFDIWSTQDNFGFIYRPIQTNVTITARVVSLANLPSGGIGGVMIRQNLTENSPHVFAGISEANDVQIFRRATPGASTTAVGGAGASPPYWLRLTRTGNTITAHQSANGTSWSQVTSYSLTLTGTVYVGLAYASFDNNALGAATFDNVSVTGPGINNPPLVSPIFPQTIAANTSTGPLPFTISDPETAAASLSLTATSSIPALVPGSGITFGGAGTNRSVTVTPATNMFGTTTVGVIVSDGTNFVTRSFALNVEPINLPTTNHPPSISVISPQTADEDTIVGPLAFTVEDPETDAANLTLTATSSVPALVAHDAILLGGTDTNRTVTLTPMTNAFGNTTISLFVSDGTNETSTSFTLEILPVNDAPLISSILSQTNDEDMVVGPLAFTIEDPETDAANLMLTATSSVPALVANDAILFGGTDTNRTLTIAPNTNAFGNTTISLFVSDGTNETSTSFTLEILPVNDAPLISSVLSQTNDEDMVVGPLAFTIEDPETDAANLTLTATSSVPALVAHDAILLGGTDTNRTVTLMPTTNAFGSATISLFVSDGTNETTTAFDLNVVPVNDPPVAGADQLARWMTQGALFPLSSLTTNDFDVEADELVVTNVASLSSDGATITTSNNWLYYAPVFGSTNDDTFTYVISDGQGGASTGLVAVVVIPDPAGDDVLSINSLGGTNVSIQLSGLPGFTYTVQSASTLSPPNWQNLTVATADETGLIVVTDPNPGDAGTRFYRAVRGVAP